MNEDQLLMGLRFRNNQRLNIVLAYRIFSINGGKWCFFCAVMTAQKKHHTNFF